MKVIMKNTVKDAKGKVIVTKGEVMTEAKAIKKGVRKCYYEVYNTSTSYTRYTKEEVLFIISSYLRNDNRVSVKDEFFAAYPNTTHTPDSVMATACQLENIDNTKSVGGYKLTDQVVC